MSQMISTTLLRGGLNLVVPAIATPPGNCIAAQNYESQVRGYSRMEGYERFDGQPQPHKATYWSLAFTEGNAEIAAGDIVTGLTSGATGYVVEDAVITGGDFGTFDATGYVGFLSYTGTFQDGEVLQIGGDTVAKASGTLVERGIPIEDEDLSVYRAAVELTRAEIEQVPGSGPVRGVWVYKGAVYAFRDNTLGTAGAMYKSTASGWQLQSLGHVIEFNTGTAEVKENETLTRAGVTSIIRRVVLVSGTWSGGNAAGYLVISNIAGGNYTAGAATTATGALTLAGAQTALSLSPGGRYSFVTRNFFGAGKTERMYGCNGVDRAFEWDGDYFTPIRTGLLGSLDKPTRIAEFANHLFLGYSHGEIQFSGIGNPLDFQVISGAGSFAFGAEVTDMSETASTALVIFGRNKIAYLAGSDSDTFVLTTLSDDSGSIAWTMQVMDTPIYQDDAGVRRMSTTQSFGNWRVGTLTEAITPLLDRKRGDSATPVASIRVKRKDQYRVFYSDGSGICIYLGRKPQECMPFEYPFKITCACAAAYNSLSGEEQLFAGSDDGFVYQLDVGTSFDGAEILAYILFPFNSVGSAMQKKRFTRAVLEVDAGPYTQIGLTSEYGYGDSDQPPGSEQFFDVSGGGGFWDINQWDRFFWSAPVQGIASAELQGIGRNVAVGVVSEAAWETPHTLSSISIYFSPRGISKTGK